MRLVLTGANYRRHRDAGLPGFNTQVVEQRLLEVVTAAAEVAVLLGVEETTAVIVRRRLFPVEDQPVALCDSYYPAALAQGTPLAEPRRIRGWRARGHRRSGRVDPAPDRRIGRRAHRPDADPRGSHRVAALARVPVVRVLRMIYDVDATPLEV